MAVSIPYMGTKRQLASAVSNLVADCRPGIFLDLFSGMCAVGSALAPRRQIWSNDLQQFSNEVARALFCSKLPRPDARKTIELCLSCYEAHQKALNDKFARPLLNERCSIEETSNTGLRQIFDESIAAAQKAACASPLGYDLFATRFGGNYISLAQAIDVDCLRKAIDYALVDERLDFEAKRWALIAICKAISCCSTTTGHFAQPLSPKPNNLARFKRQRRRSIWHEWVGAMSRLDSYGSAAWRDRNKVFNCDANNLVCGLEKGNKPSVVFADPPYTKDQYSRYYHIYETVIKYDYPAATGKGLYREDRAVSSFSQSKNIETSIAQMIERCAHMGADLIMSYPANGLLKDSREKIPKLLDFYYGSDVLCLEFKRTHSTMGASKGLGKSNVTEVLYRAKLQ